MQERVFSFRTVNVVAFLFYSVNIHILTRGLGTEGTTP